MYANQLSLISRLNRAFRNTAITLCGTSRNSSVRIERAKDGRCIAVVTAVLDNSHAGLICFSVWVAESGQSVLFTEFNSAVHFISDQRFFPAKVEQCRSWSKPVYKDQDFS